METKIVTTTVDRPFTVAEDHRGAFVERYYRGGPHRTNRRNTSVEHGCKGMQHRSGSTLRMIPRTMD